MRKVMTTVVVLALALGFVVGCGGGGEDIPAFANTHKGEFFEISYPDGWEVKDEALTGFAISPIAEDDEESSEFSFDMTAVTIQDIKAPDSKRGNVDKALEALKAEGGEEMMEMVDIETTTFAGEKAIKTSLTFLVTMESYTIPMDGWTITVAMIGSDEIALDILNTFKITDPNYSGSEDPFDFDMDFDDEDFDDDWVGDEAPNPADDTDDLFDSEEDLAVG